MNNRDLQVPTFGPATALSDSVDLKPTLRGIDVWEAGNVSVTDITGKTRTRAFTAPFPVRWAVQIKRVNATGTNISAANIDGLV